MHRSITADRNDRLLRGARLFGRDDMRHVATRGKEGTAPATLDAALPSAGYYVMRTHWTDPQGLYLFIFCLICIQKNLLKK